MTGSKTGKWKKRLFSWRVWLGSILGFITVLAVIVYIALWRISNYPDIPGYQEITDYQFLNPSDTLDCVNPHPSNPNADDPNNDLMVPSYQGWCDQQRQDYYRLPQGTNFFGLQYDWISALEKPVGKEPLVTREFMQRLGYIYDPATETNPNNPDDLPIGLTWHYDKASDAKILDVSCAACHSSQLTYRGTALVIDGGAGGHALPSLDPTQFMTSSIVSLTVTYLNPLKFNRFAKKVLHDVPEAEYSAEKAKLRDTTLTSIKQALSYGKNNFFLYPTTEGYGRTDGLGRIANTVFGDYISDKNYKTADAPVNYPHVWDIWAFDWVQWMGSVRQAMARNVNEAMGTRAPANFVHADGLYDNSVMMTEMHCIETTLQHLKPPTWPENVFGKVDPELSREGEKIFGEVCANCHGPFNRQAVDGKIDYSQTASNHSCTTCHGPLMTGADGQLLELNNRAKHPTVQLGSNAWLGNDRPDPTFELQTERGGYWEMIHIPLSYIGTDPTSAENMINNTYDLSTVVDAISEARASGANLRLPDPKLIPDPSKTAFGPGLQFLGGEIRYKQYRDWGLMDESGYTAKPNKAPLVADLNGFGESDNPVAWRAYRPRPLEGVWATAPFLHNGSVPSIYQLLLPADLRDAKFYLGRREYDPENLGLNVKAFKGAFEFNTSETGNSNLGHEFNDGLCGDGVIGYQLKDQPGYCRQLTEHERRAIIEYLKVHSDGPRPNPETQPHCAAVEWPENTSSRAPQ
ncbi:di-heme-cytochrome C peroxidase [Arenicella xantha]|uniref:Cytochrome c domain-containing protein n=1 Tax=Arenicella xantha TaxID=644221 RepID=A0A395JLU4_9GAMM|nr:di-heme-cytochrome C peroxidase [Arenicella xantha]RBP51569.1 hypothetical protein DFR28_102999 [Arenicella xantha]